MKNPLSVDFKWETDAAPWGNLVTSVGEDGVWGGNPIKSEEVANGEIILNSGGWGSPSTSRVSPGPVLQLIRIKFAVTILAPKEEIKC